MKESIGSTYLFEIVIVFVLLFTGYLCLSINYARSYQIKDSIINVIERNKGLNDVAKKQIKNYLSDVGFRTIGKCGDGYTAYDVDGKEMTDGKGVYCVRKIISQSGTEELPERAYYQVNVFYQLDLPIFNSVFSFKTIGDSYQIHKPLD